MNIYQALRCLGVLAALVAYASPSHAGDFTNCTVEEIVLAGDQNGHARLNCPIANLPPCASQSWVAFDKSTLGGRQYLAMLTYAQSIGARVEGYITQTCSPYQPNVALLNHLRVTR